MVNDHVVIITACLILNYFVLYRHRRVLNRVIGQFSMVIIGLLYWSAMISAGHDVIGLSSFLLLTLIGMIPFLTYEIPYILNSIQGNK